MNDAIPSLLVTRILPEEGMALLKRFACLDVWGEDRPMPRNELLERIHDKDGLLCLLGDRIDSEVMDNAPRLRVIGNYAVGVDNIDVDHATSRGILVVNTPGVLTDATADLAFGLILAVARRLAEGDRFIREGRFVSWSPTLMLGKQVHGATLGVVGAGKIGEAVLRRGRCFGMRLLYNSRSRKRHLEEGIGAHYRELDELLGESDFVSLNCPLTDSTRHLIGERELSLMKSDAVLVNTSRGPVVDEKALSRALSGRVIGGAGLDVYEEEPKVYPPLMELDNVILVPHIGSATTLTRGRMASMVAGGIRSIFEGNMPDNLVNPEAFHP
ncbi:MAG: D-glycerate dehydrogenase [Candidatus Thermoplasmatota archaeon]|nr:D-glycerate dehydrogenase [Candidatus Thermoplasmatota archaeon]